MFTLKNGTISLLLILAILFSGWSIFTSKKDVTVANNTKEPDAFMENITATVINEKGLPALKITSPKMVHYAENDTTDIQTPHITVFRQSPEPWRIQSDYAKATQGIDKIIFWSNVVIHHAGDFAAKATTMQTSTLTVFPNEEIAKTNAPITVLQPDTTIHAIGMLANLQKGTVTLLSQARGEYVPHS